MTLAPPFPTQQPPRKASVVRLFPTQVLASPHVARLDDENLREADSNVGRTVPVHPNSVHRGLIGVERHDRSGKIRFRRDLGVDQNDLTQADVHLTHSTPRVSQYITVVTRDRNLEGGPLPPA